MYVFSIDSPGIQAKVQQYCRLLDKLFLDGIAFWETAIHCTDCIGFVVIKQIHDFML